MIRDFMIEPNILSCLCEAEYKVPKYSTPLRLVGGLVIGWVVNNSTATVVHFPGLFLPCHTNTCSWEKKLLRRSGPSIRLFFSQLAAFKKYPPCPQGLTW